MRYLAFDGGSRPRRRCRRLYGACMIGASLARRRSDEHDRWSCSAAGCWARRSGLLPALAALALEMELIAKPARSSAGVPAAAVYRR